MRGPLAGAAVLVCAAVPIFLTHDRSDSWREVGARPSLIWLQSGAVSVRGLDGMPDVLADQARPLRGEGPLTLGGVVRGLELAGVRIELPQGGQLTADEGILDDSALTLRSIRAEGAEARLVAASARLANDQIQFAGLVVLDRGGQETVERNPLWSLELLSRHLGGR